MPAPLSALPIDPLLPSILTALERQPCLVIIAPPGAGKTTRLPPALLSCAFMQPNASAIVLQPRRVAARASAARIAAERGWTLGTEVGYQVRFERRISHETRLHVLTEGILTRRLQSDLFLEGIGCVILDEFHERGIHTDLALAMLREIQTTVRPDLRIIVMSATLNPAPVAAFLGGAPVFESPGRLYPVTIEYSAQKSSALVHEQAAQAASRMLAQPDAGHILVFLPGMHEIQRAKSLLSGVDAELHILHSSVSAELQDRALAPSPRRKLILATNIAETSLTIDGVRTVIDSGLARVMMNDTRLGIDRLELRRISRASADQRAGRAGRTAPGRCLRLWTQPEDGALEEADPPEIHRVDLCAALLAVRAFGSRDPRTFGWFEPPREPALNRAEALLRMLGAIGEKGALTDLGRRLADLPLHPRLGCLLLAGTRLGVAREATWVAALFSERDFMPSGAQAARAAAQHEGVSDLQERIDALERNERPREADPAAWQTVRHVAGDLLRRVAPARAQSTPSKEIALARALLHAYPDRVTARRETDPSRGTMVGGRGIMLEAASVVRRPPLFLSLDPRDVPGGAESRVRLACAIQEAWLREDFPELYRQDENYRFDTERGKVLAVRTTSFAGLILHETIVGASKDRAAAGEALFAHLAADAVAHMNADEAAAAWLARVTLLRRWMPELNWPAFDEDALREILYTACSGITSLDQLHARGFRQTLEDNLNWTQRAALQEHAPETYTVPSGSRIRIQYDPRGEAPVLAARLQELFGLAETPRVAAGRCAVVLHLLGPNYRPVQVTADLRNFWNTTYAEVRRDLRARYPKHPWPEDPWNAPPVAVGRRRK